MTPFVLRGGTAIDPKDGSATADADVVIEDGRIAGITRGPAPGLAPDLEVVDVTGRYLVPGYEEMHAHPLERDSPGVYELMVAHGISGFRQMSGSADLLRRRRSGDLPLPDLAPELREMPGAVLTPLNAGTERSALATVREQHAAGADFIKAAMVSPEVFGLVQQEARRLGLRVAGHLPGGLDVEEASRAGIRSIEHLGPGGALFACCSSHGDAVRESVRAKRSPTVPHVPVVSSLLERATAPLLDKVLTNPSARTSDAEAQLLAEALATYDAARARALAERFLEDGTWNVPTLMRLKTIYRADDPEFTESDELKYVSEEGLRRWRSSNDTFAQLPESTRRTFRELYQGALEMVGVFADAGAPMLAGSDVCLAGWMVPGFSLHHEFDELAAAGVPPLKVLQMTTSDAGDYLGAVERIGRLAPGADADLVVLRGDPRESVAHLHEIDGVVRAGRYLDRAALDALLDKAAVERPGF